MSKFCPGCGVTVNHAHAFCADCGSRIPGVDSAQAPAPANKKSTSLGTVVLGGILALLAVWFFLPGIFDSNSPSVLGSKKRRSPLVNALGPRTLVDKAIRIKEDQHQRFEMELKVPSHMTITVSQKKGPKFDVYVMDRKGYEEFDNATETLFGGDFHSYPALSGVVSRKAALRKSGLLPAGTYVVLLDNTDFGDTKPPSNFSNDVVVAQVKIITD